ncbi:DNA alkylation repair protein [Gammaproteobacteria bacterium 42_54_T18]|nr:DNA alkylation repair protein [Gammaproteobacteria bacterium 42_54_T18]
MPEPLKNSYNKSYVSRLVGSFLVYVPNFDGKDFHQKIFDQDWNERELKSRMDHIARMIYEVLALDYVSALNILKPVCKDFGGYEAMFFPHIIELYGIDHWDDSMAALEHMTQFSSSEFAVRPFIVKSPKKMMKQMLRWSIHDNYHVRRLSSEGCRSRLPWAMALPAFKKDPTLILPILEKLKNDESEYVRKSVANNINDITKDNPVLVKELASRWLGENKNTDWIVKHGCRTLLKKADAEVLALFGYIPGQKVDVLALAIANKTVAIGGELNFTFSLSSERAKLGMLRIEYAIDYMKSNGSQSRKIFKISEGDIQTKTKDIKRKQSFKEMSTRKHYPGKHALSIIVNGTEVKKITFDVV